MFTQFLKFGALASILVLLGASRSASKILKKPKLKKPKTEDLSPEEIALVSLKACIEDRRVDEHTTVPVLCAGFKNFREPWARDFGFAAFGLLSLGKSELVRHGLELFFSNQNSKGQLPLKFHSTVLWDRYMHSFLERAQPNDQPLKPRFLTAHGTRSLDSVLLILIAFSEYVLHTEDAAFANTWRDHAVRALKWVESYRGPKGLIKQGPFADWADSIGRKGEVFYTNVLWWRVVDRFNTLAKKFDELDFDLQESPELLAERIRKNYYQPEAGYFFQSPSSPVFASAPNFMAVAWGLATETQASSVLTYSEQESLGDIVPTAVTDRPYPNYQVGIEMWIAGITEYHTACSWMWIGSWHAIAYHRSGDYKSARATYQKMLDIIERDQAVYEVHDKYGKPLATRLYRSEEPLSWNAAMVLYAGAVVKGADKLECSESERATR